MPEVPIKPTRLVVDFSDPISKQKILEQIGESIQTGSSETQCLSELYPESEYIGRGIDVLVIGHPQNTEKVAAFHIFSDELRSNPIYALELYHIHRILHILFPHNFPQIYSVVSGANAQSIRQRIHASPQTIISFPFSKVIEQCKIIGFPLHIDDSAHNFVRGSDGGEYYLDTIMLPITHLFFEEFNKSVFEEYMRETGINSKLQKRAISSLNRLKELEIITTIEYVLTNFNDLTNRGHSLSDLSWLDDLLTLPSVSSEQVNKKSLGRIKRFVELMNLPKDDGQVREKILTYLSNRQSSE